MVVPMKAVDLGIDIRVLQLHGVDLFKDIEITRRTTDTLKVRCSITQAHGISLTDDLSFENYVSTINENR